MVHQDAPYEAEALPDQSRDREGVVGSILMHRIERGHCSASLWAGSTRRD